MFKFLVTVLSTDLNFFNDYFLSQRFMIFNNLVFQSFDDESSGHFWKLPFVYGHPKRRKKVLAKSYIFLLNLKSRLTCALAKPQ